MKLFNIYVRLFLVLLLSVGCWEMSVAQVSHGGFPYPETLSNRKTLKSSVPVPFEVMPAFDRDSLLKEDSLSGNRFGAIRFANKFFVSIDMDHSGSTSIMDDGTKIWRVGITSEGAYSLNVLFSDFDIPNQARLFVYSPDRSTILGSFTSQNRQKSGVFPIAPVYGDSIIIEYIEPVNSDFHGRLRISEVNHDYLGRSVLPAVRRASSCEVDVDCDDIHPDQRRSSCLIIVDGTAYCSGNLIANTSEDGISYVLTASHCLFDPQLMEPPVIDSKAESSVFFFNYETPYCYSDIQGSFELSVAGAAVKASYADRDMLLLEMKEMPPVDYRTYNAGWNASEDISAPAYCFHHPAGDVKKISEENDLPYTTSFNYPLFNKNSHWAIYRWEKGVTEGGSSGSGLFDGDNQLIGALSGGSSDCTSKGIDAFYKINQVWSSASVTDRENLKPWLDAGNTGTMKLDGMETYQNPCVRLSNVKSEDYFSPSQTSNHGYAAGHNDYGYLTYAEKFNVDESLSLYGVYFDTYLGKYATNYPISLKIYKGNDAPETLLCEQTVKLSIASYEKKEESWSSAYWKELEKKENYVRLDTPVSVDQNIFVVFELPEAPKDTFALYYVESRGAGEENTAYFLDNGDWKPFDQNPILQAPSSLLVDVVVRKNVTSSEKEVPSETYFTSAYVDAAGNVNLMMAEGIKTISLYDLSGRMLMQKEVDVEHYVLPMKEGVHVLQIIYPEHIEVLKIFK